MAETGLIVPRRARLRAWAALLLPPSAWYAYQQGLSMALTGACSQVGTWLGPAWGALGLAMCILGAWLTWPLPGRTYGWLARIARLGAGLFGLAIAFQLLATLIVPSCVR